jgi:prepilin-type N-terminal cleavage/methylation domain-containing protein
MHAALRWASIRIAAPQRGFTLIELLVAVLVTAVGLMAIVTTFDSSRRLVTTAERNEAATHQAEQELERIISRGYTEIGLTSAPSSSSDPNHPNYYVAGDQYQWDPDDASALEELVTTEGTFTPSRTWQDGQSRLSGAVYRYVTWIYDPSPSLVQSPDQPDAKRVIVAVTLNGQGGPSKPVVVSSIVFDEANA